MLIAESFRAACVVGLLGTAALVSLRAQEAPAVPPAQEQRAPDSPADQASRIFGPVRRTPPSAPEEFLPRFPQHRSSDGERRPWFQAVPVPPAPATSTPQPTSERAVCLRTVRVDPNVDPRIVQPVPSVGAVIQRVVPPPCVQTSEPINRP